jgi:hypothetical protein
VHCDDDDIEPPKNGVGKRKTAVLAYLHLRTLENGEVRAAFLELIDFIDLLRESLGIHPVGNSDVLRVIGDGNIAQVPAARR